MVQPTTPFESTNLCHMGGYHDIYKPDSSMISNDVNRDATVGESANLFHSDSRSRSQRICQSSM